MLAVSDSSFQGVAESSWLGHWKHLCSSEVRCQKGDADTVAAPMSGEWEGIAGRPWTLIPDKATRVVRLAPSRSPTRPSVLVALSVAGGLCPGTTVRRWILRMVGRCEGAALTRVLRDLGKCQGCLASHRASCQCPVGPPVVPWPSSGLWSIVVTSTFTQVCSDGTKVTWRR